MTSLRSEVVEIAPARVRIEDSSYSDSDEQAGSSRLSKFTKCVLLALTVIIAVPFGAVHNSIYLPVSALVFTLTAAHLLFSRDRIESVFAPSSISRGAMKFLLCFLGYVAVQTAYLSFAAAPHPVLGKSDGILRSGALWSGVSMLTFFTAVFFLTRLYVIPDSSFKRKLFNSVLLAGVVVSLIGVSHWFYDNGKLFWIFEPENLFLSDRARWPFVNANHLGHFLLPIFFLFIAKLGDEVELVIDYQRRHQKNERQTLSQLAHSSRLQGRLVKTGFAFCFLLAVLLTIVGTLSRGTWFGLSVGIVCYYLLSRKRATEAKNDNANQSVPKRRHSRRKTSFSFDAFIEHGRQFARPAILILAAVFLIFFFSERGTDLVTARIDYGLMYSKDDMRWQLYSDTLPMIRENPFFGVGMGGWRAEYPRFMTHLMSGVDPVYLHSEPLQMLAEFGILGSLILLSLFAYCTKHALRALRILRSRDPAKARKLTAIICGLMGFFAASFFDFPLRMPSIVFMLGVYLALTTFYADLAKTSR